MMEEYLELFISETEGYIKELNQELLKLERDNKNRNSILEVFRILHTIKGMAQTMGFEGLGNLAHSVEDLLIEPKAKGEINKQIVEFVFAVTDYLANFLQTLRSKSALPPSDTLISLCADLKAGKDVFIERAGGVGLELGEIKIKMAKLDTLFNLTNELLIIRSRLIKLGVELANADLQILSETAARIITVLQDEIMRLRMLPLSSVFEFFPRWVRDEAKKQSKEVDFQMVGGELEVDRSIIEILKEPVMHLLRNALDHGIEKKGKIILSAQREQEFVRISIIDDGKGIDTEEIRKMIVAKNLVDYQTARDLSKEELYRFLLRPDFSTKKDVTTVSGRGIGLDIVHSFVSELGGRFQIKSEKGKGSTFTIELPISLAIVRSLILGLDGQRFALPLSYVTETFYIDENDIQKVYKKELIKLRDTILPLVRIGERLDCLSKKGKKSVVIVNYEGHRRGFIVDEIVDEQEIVVKKADRMFASSFYSGCSIYADGKPILILDPRGFE